MAVRLTCSLWPPDPHNKSQIGSSENQSVQYRDPAVPVEILPVSKSSFVKQEDVSHTPLLYPKKAVVSSDPTIYSGFLEAVALAR
mgnify:CR=1 FL=1